MSDLFGSWAGDFEEVLIRIVLGIQRKEAIGITGFGLHGGDLFAQLVVFPYIIPHHEVGGDAGMDGQEECDFSLSLIPKI